VIAVAGYRLSDDLSGGLIVSLLVFSPWAFGTTQPWAIQCMNFVGYALGVLLLFKWFCRRTGGCQPADWDHFSPRSGTFSRRQSPAVRELKRLLAGLTVAVLAECLVSALNAAAVYHPETRVFHYQAHWEWLPHSFDRDRTWSCFWKYLGLAGTFWAVSDWLMGLSPAEELDLADATPAPALRGTRLPDRWRTLLWVLAVNGAILGIEGILQRESGTDKLLFVLQPRMNQGGESQFGPYAYRSNAAQYFNLLWPLTLGFWLALRRAGQAATRIHFWLLACAAIMAACPIISTSRAGALISLGMLVVLLVWVLARPPVSGVPTESSGASREPVGLLALFALFTLLLGGCLGWHALAPRLHQIGSGFEGRENIYTSAEPMAGDYPLYGTGPGTFATVYQLYRISDETFWPEQLHDDWLETRITFGWLGFALLLAALAGTALRSFMPGGVRGHRHLVVGAWVALAGCLVHARFDYPFQIHSTLLLFLVICALLLNLGRHTAASSSGRQ